MHVFDHGTSLETTHPDLSHHQSDATSQEYMHTTKMPKVLEESTTHTIVTSHETTHQTTNFIQSTSDATTLHDSSSTIHEINTHTSTSHEVTQHTPPSVETTYFIPSTNTETTQHTSSTGYYTTDHTSTNNPPINLESHSTSPSSSPESLTQSTSPGTIYTTSVTSQDSTLYDPSTSNKTTYQVTTISPVQDTSSTNHETHNPETSYGTTDFMFSTTHDVTFHPPSSYATTPVTTSQESTHYTPSTSHEPTYHYSSTNYESTPTIYDSTSFSPSISYSSTNHESTSTNMAPNNPSTSHSSISHESTSDNPLTIYSSISHETTSDNPSTSYKPTEEISSISRETTHYMPTSSETSHITPTNYETTHYPLTSSETTTSSTNHELTTYDISTKNHEEFMNYTQPDPSTQMPITTTSNATDSGPTHGTSEVTHMPSIKTTHDSTLEVKSHVNDTTTSYSTGLTNGETTLPVEHISTTHPSTRDESIQTTEGTHSSAQTQPTSSPESLGTTTKSLIDQNDHTANLTSFPGVTASVHSEETSTNGQPNISRPAFAIGSTTIVNTNENTHEMETTVKSSTLFDATGAEDAAHTTLTVNPNMNETSTIAISSLSTIANGHLLATTEISPREMNESLTHFSRSDVTPTQTTTSAALTESFGSHTQAVSESRVTTGGSNDVFTSSSSSQSSINAVSSHPTDDYSATHSNIYSTTESTGHVISITITNNNIQEESTASLHTNSFMEKVTAPSFPSTTENPTTSNNSTISGSDISMATATSTELLIPSTTESSRDALSPNKHQPNQNSEGHSSDTTKSENMGSDNDGSTFSREGMTTGTTELPGSLVYYVLHT